MPVLRIEVVSGEIQIIRKELDPAELYPINQRFEDDTMQYTPDGGTTWIDAPELDPRNQTSIAPRPGSDVPCQSAGSVVEYIKRFINMVVPLILASATLVQGASSIVGFLGIISGAYSVLWSLITGVFATLTSFGGATIRDSFDDAVYHEIVCILQCHMDASGQLNQGSLDAAMSQISVDVGGTAADVTNLILTIMGFAGVNRAASFYVTETDCGDCSSCEWCYLWSGDNVPSWGFYPDADFGGGQRGSFSGSNWVSSNKNTAVRATEIMMRILLSFPVTITEVSVTFAKTAGTFNLPCQDVIVVDSPNGYYNGTIIKTVNANGHAGGVWSWAGSQLVNDEITIWLFGAEYTGSGSFGSLSISSVLIRGEGANPFGETNC